MAVWLFVRTDEEEFHRFEKTQVFEEEVISGLDGDKVGIYDTFRRNSYFPVSVDPFDIFRLRLLEIILLAVIFEL